MKAFVPLGLGLAISIALASCSSGADSARSGRIHVDPERRTLVGAHGEPLRGAYWSTDWEGKLPTAGYLAGLKARKLNSLHLYAESFASGLAPGSYAAQVDEMVARTKAEGMYLVITIGNWDRNGSYDLAFALGFWSFYAKRFARELHVAYEIQNEPVAWFPGYPAEALAMERELYALIRAEAPDTPILLLSYANLRDPPAIGRDLDALEGSVDWSKAAVAFHGYSGATMLGDCLRYLRERGIPAVNTEFWDPAKGKVGDDRYQVLALCEEFGLSWLLFFTEGQIEDPGLFDSELAYGKVSW